MQRQTHKIDASEKTLGRLASQVAILLRGKQRPEYQPNADAGDFVFIQNMDQVKVTGKKLDQKYYHDHSGYPGGLRRASLRQVVAHKGMSQALRRAVWNMLPKNKLRKEMIKRLMFK